MEFIKFTILAVLEVLFFMAFIPITMVMIAWEIAWTPVGIFIIALLTIYGLV